MLGEELTKLIRADIARREAEPPWNRLMYETNRHRRKHGRAILVRSPDLFASAQHKADDMANNNYYGHDSPDGVTMFDLGIRYGYLFMAENLAQSHSRTLAVGQWMHSPGHNNNQLRAEWTGVGFGVAKMPSGLFVVVGHYGTR